MLKSSTDKDQVGQWEKDLIEGTDNVNKAAGNYLKTVTLYDVFTKETFTFDGRKDACKFCEIKDLSDYTHLIKSRWVRLYYGEDPMMGVQRLATYKARRLNDPATVHYFVSQSHMSDTVGISTSQIVGLLGRNKLQQSRQWQMSRIDEPFKALIPDYLPKGKHVKCLNNNKDYNSAKSAGEDLNLDASSIARVARGERPHTKGFKFEYLVKI